MTASVTGAAPEGANATPLFDTWWCATAADPEGLTATAHAVLDAGAHHTAGLADGQLPHTPMGVRAMFAHREAIASAIEAAVALATNPHTPAAAVAALVVPVTLAAHADPDGTLDALAAVAAQHPPEVLDAVRVLATTHPLTEWRTLGSLAEAVTDDHTPAP